MNFLIASVFISIFISISFAKTYSPVDCGGRSWEVHYNDTNELNDKFQRWIFAYQNLCDNRKIQQSSVTLSAGGIGCRINSGALDLVWSIERKQIFRPSGDWLWADHNKTKCSLSIRSTDCFTQPISYCSIDNTHFTKEQKEEMRKDLAALSPISFGYDSCGMGEVLHKPLQWVLSHFISYFVRYEESIKREIDTKLAIVFGDDLLIRANSSSFDTTSIHSQSLSPLSPLSPDAPLRITKSTPKSTEKKNYTTIGVHIRGGLPDSGRVPINESVYMHYVDLIADKMKLQNMPVKLVFLCSHTQELNIIDTDHMTTTYPRPFRFSVLPHISTGKGESEYAVRDNLLDNRALVLEFYTDIEILTKVDYFIALRIARGIHKHNNQTCFLDLHLSHHDQLVCEGDVNARAIWRSLPFGGFNAKKDTVNWFNPNATAAADN